MGQNTSEINSLQFSSAFIGSGTRNVRVIKLIGSPAPWTPDLLIMLPILSILSPVNLALLGFVKLQWRIQYICRFRKLIV